MAEPERKKRHKTLDALQVRRQAKDYVHETGQQRVKVPHEFPLIDTQVRSTTEANTALLSRARTQREQCIVLFQLQRTHGNNYVRDLLKSSRNDTLFRAVQPENIPPPIPTNKPWKKKPPEKSNVVSIQYLLENGLEVGGKLKGPQLIEVANFATGINNIGEGQEKTDLIDSAINLADKSSSLLGHGGAGSNIAMEAVKQTLGEGSKEKVVLGALKAILGPIPDAITTVVSAVKTIYAIAKGKGKEAWEAGWETAKSTFNATTGVISTVLELVGGMQTVVPILGGIAKGIMAVVDFFEAAKGTIEKMVQSIATLRILGQTKEQLKELNSPQQKKLDNVEKKKRLKYIIEINEKRLRNEGRELQDQFTGIVAAGAKLASGVTSVIGGILLITGVAAPVTAIVDAFALGLDVFEWVSKTLSKIVVYGPKIGNFLRQIGRDVAANENIFGKIARGLGFNPEKSTLSKNEERKRMVAGFITQAKTLKTEFDQTGKDEDQMAAIVKMELPAYEGLDWELQAMGVERKELYKLNAETSLGKRLKGQIALIYQGLKKR